MPDLLADLAAKHGFAQHVDVLRRYALPCVGFSLTPCADAPIGSSRLGGGPDLPPGFEWPMYCGRPLDFLLQVNLADVAPHDRTGLFPSSGLLTFFYDLTEQPWGYDPDDLSGHAVRYFPSPEGLIRHPAPHPDLDEPLNEASLSFWPAECLPDLEAHLAAGLTPALGATKWHEVDLDAYCAISSGLFYANAPSPDAPCHRLGGHSANIQGDMQLEAELVTHGLFCGDSSGWNDARAKELERTCEEWQLLLQLDSDDDGGLMWGDVGMLYFWARQPDLAARDYSKTWLGLQCG